MNATDTLWHLERVANSGILGQPEKIALKQAGSLLAELVQLHQMPQQTAEQVTDFRERLDALLLKVGTL